MFTWAFHCTWVYKVCSKCIAAKNLPSGKSCIKRAQKWIEGVREKSAGILIRKRKPLTLSIEDLDATDENDSDFEVDIDIKSIYQNQRCMPKRKCVKEDLEVEAEDDTDFTEYFDHGDLL